MEVLEVFDPLSEAFEALDLTDFLDALYVPDDDELEEDDEDDLELPFEEDVFLGGDWADLAKHLTLNVVDLAKHLTLHVVCP